MSESIFSEVTICNEYDINELCEDCNWDLIVQNQKLSEDFIIENLYRLDWDLLVRYQVLSEDFIIRCKLYVDWELVSQYQNFPNENKMIFKTDNILGKLSDDILTFTQSARMSNNMITLIIKHINYYKEYLNHLPLCISCEHAKKPKPCAKYLNKVYDHESYKSTYEFLYKNLLTYQKLSPENIAQIQIYNTPYSWNLVLQYQLNSVTDEIMTKHHLELDWKLISQYQKLSINSMIKFKKLLDWDLISQYQELSEEAFQKFDKKLNWKLISQYQKLSAESMSNFLKLLDLDLVAKYQDLSESWTVFNYYNIDWKSVMRHQKLCYNTKQYIEKVILKRNWTL
jgi:hypothetical protein